MDVYSCLRLSRRQRCCQDDSFTLLFTCSCAQALQCTDTVKSVSIHIRIVVLLLIFLSQRGKRSTRIALWRVHARQMCCLGYWECGSSQLSCGHLLFRAQHKPAKRLFSVVAISDVGRTGIKGSQENGPGFNAETFLLIWKA